jgi:hypothetical protein
MLSSIRKDRKFREVLDICKIYQILNKTELANKLKNDNVNKSSIQNLMIYISKNIGFKYFNKGDYVFHEGM